MFRQIAFDVIGLLENWNATHKWLNSRQRTKRRETLIIDDIDKRAPCNTGITIYLFHGMWMSLVDT
jgi:hypothetical protein